AADALDILAPHVAHLFKATSRFLKLAERFMPEAPQLRPSVGQIKWTRRGLKDALSLVYEWRSRALHAGVPFPAPMCEPPMHFENAYAEKSPGIASHSRNATWMSEDTPLNLHIFDYITRGSLLNWWGYL